MEQNAYFKEALSGFAADVAYAEAVRHLHDRGLTVAQIKKELSFPASDEQINKVISEYEEKKKSPEKEYEYVEHIDEYGKKCFLKVKRKNI